MSTVFLNTRRRHIYAKGRPMTLRQQVSASPLTYQALALTGLMMSFRPEEITGDIRQGDARVLILNDEISAAAWPNPVSRTFSIVIDGRTWAIQGVVAQYDGPTLTGFNLWVRGGA